MCWLGLLELGAVDGFVGYLVVLICGCLANCCTLRFDSGWLILGFDCVLYLFMGLCLPGVCRF